MNAFTTAVFYGPSTFATGTVTPLKWGPAVSIGTQNIQHTDNAAPFRVAAAGAYLITCNMTIDSTGFSSLGPTNLAIQTSTNGTTYTSQIIVPQNYQFPGNQNIYCYGTISLPANAYIQIVFGNSSGGAVAFSTTAAYSNLQITRVC
jgi:hypothetical protein